MRRSSVITIILLVLVIIGLTVALVFTNLPEKENVDNNAVESNEELENKNEPNKEENVKTISLNDDRVKEMYRMVNKGDTEFFHYFKKGSITVKDFTDEDIQTIAYFNSASEKQERIEGGGLTRTYRLETKYMDEAIKKIFGNIECEHTGARFQDSGINSELVDVASYNKEDDVYYIASGFGGGGDTAAITAIVKAEEYDNRYEVTEKLLVTVANSYTSNANYSIYPFYGTKMRFVKYLGNITEEEIGKITDTKEMYSYNFYSEASNELTIKLISKYYDYCTEYKHTFMKNEDGSFYWYKSEIVK